MDKKPKRANGEGTKMKWNEKRQKWEQQISIGGKRPTLRADSQNELRKMILIAQGDDQRGTYIKPSKELFKTYLDNWLKSKKLSVKLTTWKPYSVLVRLHIEPEIGNTSLQKLTRQNIQDVLLKKSETHKASTVRQMAMIIKNSLELAVTDKKILQSPYSKIELPQIILRKVDVLTTEIIEALLKVCFKTRIYPVTYLNLSCGMRRGEILGLSWKNVFWDSSEIEIEKQWVLENGMPCWHEEPKTDSGFRRVEVPPEIITMLETWRSNKPNDIYVFQAKNGLPQHPGNFRRDFKRWVRAAQKLINENRKKENPDAELINIDAIRFHDIRHNYGTQLAARKIHQRLIESQMGHKDYRSSRRYIHATKEGKQEAASAISDAMKSIQKPSCTQIASTKKKASETKSLKP